MMERSGCLLLMQIDHLSGEEIGHLVETLYAWGAGNVQILSTVTKKNRLGHLALVDAGAGQQEDLARKLVLHYGITGYHRIETVHYCERVNPETRPLVVACGEATLKMDLPVMVVGDGSSALFVRAEYEGLRELGQRLVRAFGVEPSRVRLKLRIDALLAAGKPLQLHIDPKSAEVT
jgi:uncharacterized protein (DUF111 family)